MADVTQLTLAVDSRQVNSAAAALDQFSAAGKRSETAATRLQASFRSFGTLLKGFSAAVVAREIIQVADSYQNLNARLKLVTLSAGDFAKTQKDIFDISQRTRTGLEETAGLYGSLARSTESLGVSQGDLLGVTETINQALAVSGTSAQAASAALVQLGQGFASGALRGEELNSVLEQAPRLAKAIADGMGVSVGQLRELGKEGSLTAEKVFNALRKSGADIKKEFETLPVTVGQASTQSANALMKLIGTMDEVTGATSALSKAISGAAGFLSELADEIKRAGDGHEDVGFLAQAFLVVEQTVKILWANLKFVFEGMGREIGAIAAQIVALGKLDIDGFNAISKAVTEDAERARAELDSFERRVLNLSKVKISPDDQSEAEARRLGLRRPTPTASAPVSSGGDKKKISDAERYLESLKKQFQATKDLSVADTLLADIQAGRLGKVTQKQRDELLGVALQIDAAKALAEVRKEEAQAREGASKIAEAANDAALKETQGLVESNKALSDEIQLLGKSAAERAEIERLRLDSAIAIKEEALGLAQLSAASKIETQALEDQIRLLKQRRDLVAAKGSAEAAVEESEKLKDSAKQLGLTFTSAFEDAIVGGKKLSDVFEGLGKDILRLSIRKSITEPMVAAASALLTGGGGFLANLIGGAIGGRALGGPVSAGGMYRVNEKRGPELLDVAGQQYLMMGSQGGSVSPNAGGDTYVYSPTVSAGVTRNELVAALQMSQQAMRAEMAGAFRRMGA